mgnify:CR=1 FL=1|jgi:hypothetical protein
MEVAAIVILIIFFYWREEKDSFIDSPEEYEQPKKRPL